MKDDGFFPYGLQMPVIFIRKHPLPSPLQLPPTLRAATADELPDTPEYRQRVVLLENALIVPGYTFRKNDDTQDPFNFFSEINIDNDQLWDLFTALAKHLPPEACLLYHHADESPSYSPYMDRDDLITQLEQLSVELSKDDRLCIGILYHGDDRLEEVYISNTKYLRYWGVEEDIFRLVMEQFGLSQVDGLQFIDEFPRVAVPLQRIIPDCLDTWEVLGKLLQHFGRV